MKRHPYTFDQEIRGLSVLQPWSFLIVAGAKRVETRPRDIGARPGEWLAIHASRARVSRALEREVWAAGGQGLAPGRLTRGAIVGVARVVAVARVDANGLVITKGRWPWDVGGPREERLGDWSAGRFLIALEDARALYRPIPCRGMLGRWRVAAELRPQIARELIWPTTDEAEAAYMAGGAT